MNSIVQSITTWSKKHLFQTFEKSKLSQDLILIEAFQIEAMVMRKGLFSIISHFSLTEIYSEKRPLGKLK